MFLFSLHSCRHRNGFSYKSFNLSCALVHYCYYCYYKFSENSLIKSKEVCQVVYVVKKLKPVSLQLRRRKASKTCLDVVYRVTTAPANWNLIEHRIDRSLNTSRIFIIPFERNAYFRSGLGRRGRLNSGQKGAKFRVTIHRSMILQWLSWLVLKALNCIIWRFSGQPINRRIKELTVQ